MSGTQLPAYPVISTLKVSSGTYDLVDLAFQIRFATSPIIGGASSIAHGVLDNFSVKKNSGHLFGSVPVSSIVSWYESKLTVTDSLLIFVPMV